MTPQRTYRKIGCIIQARTGSTRLPNKVLLPIYGKPMILRVIDRTLESKLVDEIIVATTTNPNDTKIVELVQSYNPKVKVFRGSEEDVLDRYYQAAKELNIDILVRVTGDCPLLDPDVIDSVITKYLADPSLDFVSTVIGKHTYPRGVDIEAISFSVLKQLWETTTETVDREHVTIHIKRFPENFVWASVESDKDYSSFRWTVDEQADYELVNILYQRLFPQNPHFRMKDVVNLYKEDPALRTINQHVEQKNSKY
ncbi:MAG: glycosyltransferase family protein [Candidatus Yanofskybacteria bacterium]|nr:glycosyltransferase family protein [Candidatus Yanofskybacteria bacterium]